MSKDNWILSSTVNFNSIVSKIEFIQDWVKNKDNFRKTKNERVDMHRTLCWKTSKGYIFQ